MLADLRFALRLLAHNPGFSAAAILTLTLGIGMTTAILSVVDGVLLRPIPFPDPERLVVLWETDRDSSTAHEPASYPDFRDFQQRSRRVDRIAGLIAGETTLTPDRGDPSRLASLIVTHDLLPLLGIQPMLGRHFTADDDRVGGPQVVLISERLWDRVFQRDPKVTDRTIRIDDQPRTIAGVVPRGSDLGVLQLLEAADYGRGFADRDARSEVDVWAPLQADAETLPRSTHPVLLVGRLAAGASITSAQEELAAIAADLEQAFPINKGRGVLVEPLRDVIFGPSEPALLVLLAGIGLVFLTACANVAHLLLARGTARAQEVAVRAALGAETRQLAQQFAVENALLTLVASVLGVALAFGALRVLIVMAPPEVPRLASVAIDFRVLAMTMTISVVAAFAFGLVPLTQAFRTDLRTALHAEDARRATSSRKGRLMRSGLVVAELALAVVLVTGAGLLMKSFWTLQRVDPGFDAAGVLKAEFLLPATRYPVNFKVWPNFPEMHRFNAALTARVAALPGVEGVAIAGNHPLDAGYTNSFSIVGREAESNDFPELSIRRVTPSYFRVVRVPVIAGRAFSEADHTDAPPVVVINEAAARRFFPGREAVGHQISFWGAKRTIVGVIASEKFHGLAEAAPLAAYAPLAQLPSTTGGEAVIVRAAGDPAGLAGALRGAIAEVDPGLAVFGLEPLQQTLSQSTAQQRFLALLVSLFAGLALMLAAVGIHGVLSYSVAQRTREIGIRVSLGASALSVSRMILGQTALLTVMGLSIGAALAYLFAKSMAGLLFGVEATDPATFAGSVVALAAVALLASWLPARRALRIDPIDAFRQG